VPAPRDWPGVLGRFRWNDPFGLHHVTAIGESERVAGVLLDTVHLQYDSGRLPDIAGMFYLLDDAFRVGEYIQSGNYKGTVEGFSHSLGQVGAPPRPGLHRAVQPVGGHPEPEPRLGHR
jgi:hypothetical protein